MEDDPKMEMTKKVCKEVTYAVPSKRSEEVLLMISRVKVMASDGSIMQARALLDSLASTSLITDRLFKKLSLPRHRSNFQINGIAGLNVHPRGTVSFNVAEMRGVGKQIEEEASVFPKVTEDLPTVPVSQVTRWKHLSDLELAHPD